MWLTVCGLASGLPTLFSVTPKRSGGKYTKRQAGRQTAVVGSFYFYVVSCYHFYLAVFSVRWLWWLFCKLWFVFRLCGLQMCHQIAWAYFSIIFQCPVLSLPMRSILPLSLSSLIFRLMVLKLIFKRSLISLAVILLFCFINENTVSFTVSF